MPIASAFEEILKAQRSLCNDSSTSSSSDSRSSSTRGVTGSVGNGYGDKGFLHLIPDEESSSDNEGLISLTRVRQEGRMDKISGDRSSDSGDDVKRDNSDDEDEEEEENTHPTPHASICGKHPAIRFYRRHISSKNATDGNQVVCVSVLECQCVFVDWSLSHYSDFLTLKYSL